MKRSKTLLTMKIIYVKTTMKKFHINSETYYLKDKWKEKIVSEDMQKGDSDMLPLKIYVSFYVNFGIIYIIQNSQYVETTCAFINRCMFTELLKFHNLV